MSLLLLFAQPTGGGGTSGSIDATESGVDIASISATATAPAQGTCIATETSSDPFFSNVSLLVHADGPDGSTNIVDSSSVPHSLVAVGDAQLDTAQSKFGGSSLALDGTTDGVSIGLAPEFTFGVGDFTVEGWIRPSDVTGSRAILTLGRYSGDSTGIIFYINAGKLAAYSNTTAYVASTATVSTDTWTHVAWVRSAGTLKMYCDGAEVFSSAFTADLNPTSWIAVGYDAQFSNAYFVGHIDDLRVTKGVARYTPGFTPATAAFPDGNSSGDSFAGDGTTATFVNGTLSSSEAGTDAFAGAGVSPVAGSATTTESGPDTMSGSGVVLVGGSAAAVEVALDTFAATGGVPGASGLLTATESGSDTAVGNGAVLAAGTMASAEQTADTFAASGSVLTSGTLTSVETGPDTATASGATFVAGNVAATETIADSALFTGAVAVVGSMTPSEVGSDSAAISGNQGAPAERVGNFAATETGADIAAFSGTAPAQGALSVVEVGADIATIDGGAIKSVGSIAAAETGGDVYVGAGQAYSTGTITGVESGADTANLIGVLPLSTGYLVVSETGEDVAGFSGEGLVFGLFAAAEVGEDIAVFSNIVFVPAGARTFVVGAEPRAVAVPPEVRQTIAVAEARVTLVNVESRRTEPVA